MLELLAIPHHGVGPFVFGSSRRVIIERMGHPDAIEASKDRPGEHQEEWHFEKLHITLTFTEEDDWKLSVIGVSGTNCTIKGISFIDQSIGELHAQCKAAGIHDLREDGDYDECGICYVSDQFDLMFWTVDGYVSSLHLFPQFDKTEECVCWPEPAPFR